MVFIRSLLTIVSLYVMKYDDRHTSYHLKAFELPEHCPICVFQLKKTVGIGKKKNTWSQDDTKAAFDACKNEHKVFTRLQSDTMSHA